MTASSAALSSKPVSPFAVFRNRNFAWMWPGQLVSTIGSALTSLDASIYVYRMTSSAASVGLMLMATVAPSLVVGLIAGAIVDRFDRRRIMIAADCIRAVLVFSIPFLVPLNIARLYIIVGLSSAVGQFFGEIAALTGAKRTADVVTEEGAARCCKCRLRYDGDWWTI